MKKLFIIGLLALAGAAIYFGVISFRSGDDSLSVRYDRERASQVVEEIKEGAGKALGTGGEKGE